MMIVESKSIKNIPVLEVVLADRKDESLPLVIFYHGWTGCKERVLTQGYEIAKKGFRVVLPDAIYHGDRATDGPAEKHQLQFWQIIANSVKEFPDIIKFYKDEYGIKEDKIGVSGLSMGGITTCALLSIYSEITAAVCLMGSPRPVEFARTLLDKIPGVQDIDPAYVEKELEQLSIIDLSRNPQKIAGRPVHFWHATADRMVPYKPTKEFYDRIKDHSYADKVSFTTTQGGGHKVSQETTVEMAEKFYTYFR
ncbi:alpha/beta fold hydrolase [Liquorilactobacillus cacaonum]|uniref:S9 family serine peptidase n=1 Tax=Liquorilactobacillus cacaonum DSM 21116 TaxID=1423729 RepID=A0A0R2CGZ1_9LACO|nr:alpha/beta fold hydrolase [Liquorilactobacillus cacaonum]KRM90888.1 S9 family serine peptidase [Liquorilactobacillus cacaonum DSM 21116]